MPTKRVELNTDHLKEAREAAAARTYPTAKPLFLADMNEKGLRLRVRGGKADWILCHGKSTRTLGTLGPERGNLKPGEIRAIKDARELAQKTRAILKDGTDPKAFLTGTAAGKSEEDAATTAERRASIAAGKWTWEILVEKYADGYLSEPRMTTRGILKQPSIHTAKETRRYLTMEEAKPLFGKLLSELRPGDLEEVRDACAMAGRKTASRQFVAYSKGALSFARKKHSRAAGLEGSPKWWLEVEKLDSTIPAPRERHPTLQELARALYVAEKFRTIPGRKNSRETSETVLAALWFLALTAQRVTAGLSLRKAHVLPWPDGPDGWKVVYFPPEMMKGRRPHAIPVPSRVALLFDRAAREGQESTYVFPATRATGEEDSPLSRWSVATLIDRLRGRPADTTAYAEARKKAKKNGEPLDFDELPDLLEGLPDFSPHDFRRTFATTCEDLTVRGDAISAVLDHVDVGSGQEPIRTADITRLAYAYSQRLSLKQIAVEAWTNAVFEAVEAEWAKHRAPRPAGRPAPPPRPSETTERPAVSAHEPWYRTYERWERTRKLAQPPRLLLGSINRGSHEGGEEPYEAAE